MRRVDPANMNPEAGLPLFESAAVQVHSVVVHGPQGAREMERGREWSAEGGTVTFADGAALRDQGAAAALDAEARKHELAWAIKKAAQSFPEFTTDEVRDILAEIGVHELEHPNALSAAVLAAAREGIIEEVNKAPRRSTRPEARRRKLTI